MVKQFKLGCFALAAPDQSNAAGIATGVNKSEAEARAIAFCRQYSGGRFCTVSRSFCDSVDGPLVQFVAERQEAEALARRSDITSQSGQSCSLSAKSISYSHRRCAEGTCDAKFGMLEIVGKSVLEYAGGKATNKGIQFELGRTNEVSQDWINTRHALDNQPSRPQPAGSTTQTLVTASYDGRSLTLYHTGLTVARADSNYPDGTLLGALSVAYKFKIDNCNTCTVTEYAMVGQTIGGRVSLPAFLNAPIAEQTCKIDSMK